MDFASCVRRPAGIGFAAMPFADRAARPSTSTLALDPNEDLEHALAQGLKTPVAALRASVEGLSCELRGVTPRPAAIPGALEEVELLGRNVQRLLEWAGPVQPAPLRCRVEEILRTSTRAFRALKRSRVLAVSAARDLSLLVDGPLLSGLLQRLLENALEGGSDDVLLRVALGAHRITFSVVNQAAHPFDPEWAMQPFHTTMPNRLGLGLAVAGRHAELLGGTLTLHVSAEGVVRTTVELPLRSAEGEGATPSAPSDRELAA